MDLILWRHADAADGNPDAERKLTDKGHAQAKRMAAWLNTRLPEGAVVLASPARRARETAQALKRKFTVSDSLATSADARDLLAAAGWPRETQGSHAVVIVGHQPTLGRVASLLLTGAEGELSVKKGAVWWISTRMRGGKPQAVLCAVMTPDLFRKD